MNFGACPQIDTYSLTLIAYPDFIGKGRHLAYFPCLFAQSSEEGSPSIVYQKMCSIDPETLVISRWADAKCLFSMAN